MELLGAGMAARLVAIGLDLAFADVASTIGHIACDGVTEPVVGHVRLIAAFALCFACLSFGYGHNEAHLRVEGKWA